MIDFQCEKTGCVLIGLRVNTIADKTSFKRFGRLVLGLALASLTTHIEVLTVNVSNKES